MRKIIFMICFLCFSIVLLIDCLEKPCYELENNIVRLHIIANGNSEKEQSVKLSVRDRIIDFANENGRVPTLFEAENIANAVLAENAEEYKAKAEFGKFYITRRQYDNFNLPFGRYTTMKIELGEAKGKNWWCVISPPLCFTKSSLGSSETINQRFSRSTNEVISGKINIKFKTIELYSKVMQKITE